MLYTLIYLYVMKKAGFHQDKKKIPSKIDWFYHPQNKFKVSMAIAELF